LHDACLGRLPGVSAACCGHGRDDEAYIRFNDGTELRGSEAVELRSIWVSYNVSPETVIRVYLLVHDLSVTDRFCSLSMSGYPGDELIQFAKVFAESA
jgi:hypothetical protein